MSIFRHLPMFSRRAVAVTLLIAGVQIFFIQTLFSRYSSVQLRLQSDQKESVVSPPNCSAFEQLRQAVFGRSFRIGSTPHFPPSSAVLDSTGAEKSPEPQCHGWHGADQAKKNVGLLVAVKTAPGRAEKRQKLRQRWAEQCVKGMLTFPARPPGSGTKWADGVQCVFVVGHSKDADVEEGVKREQDELGDGIVVAPMVDTYETMTSKTVWTLLWSLRTYCYRHLLFVDDDAHVFFSRLLPYLSENSPERQSGLYQGHSRAHLGYQVYHCHRFPNSNCVDEKIYPRSGYYPFASGFSYMLSRDVAAKALEMAVIHVSSPLTLPGNVEDAMMAHLLHEGNISLKAHVGFVHWHSKSERCPNMVKHDSPVLVVGNAPDDVLEQFAKNEKSSLPLCTGI